MPAYKKTVTVPGKSAQELYSKVAADLGKFLEKAGVGHADIKNHPHKHCVEMDSKMFSATLQCSDGSITIDGKLSLLATPFKGKIDEGIEKWLKKAF